MSRQSWTSLHVFLSWKWWFCKFHGTVSCLLQREMHCFIIFLTKFGIFMRYLNVSETSCGTAFLRNFMVYKRLEFRECPPAGHWASSRLLSQSWENDLLPGAAWALCRSFLSPGSRSFFPHPPGWSTTGSSLIWEGSVLPGGSIPWTHLEPHLVAHSILPGWRIVVLCPGASCFPPSNSPPQEDPTTVL